MTLLVKRLPHKQDVLRSGARTHIQRQVWYLMSAILMLGEAEGGRRTGRAKLAANVGSRDTLSQK